MVQLRLRILELLPEKVHASGVRNRNNCHVFDERKNDPAKALLRYLFTYHPSLAHGKGRDSPNTLGEGSFSQT